MFCRECGAEIYNGAAFCGKCGAKAIKPAKPVESNIKVCPKCQYANVSRASFCLSCGASLSDKNPIQEQKAAVAMPPQAAPVQMSTPAPAPVPVAEKKSKPKKKDKFIGLKVLLIIICVLLLIAGVWLVPNGISAAREGKPVRAPWETTETFLEEEEDIDVPMDWIDLPQDPIDGEEDE
ncbi:MAG: zinc ribbon domain-containing protein [Clostridiales bacterium]|nr:zinc ribbon domain-containing protein [Clostridiales bacterium]